MYKVECESSPERHLIFCGEWFNEDAKGELSRRDKYTDINTVETEVKTEIEYF